MSVTVIIPCYNTEAYIDECIESVCRQTLDDMEVIIIDDASTDNTYELISQKIKNDRRFNLVRMPENRGQSYARNIGIFKANKDYICFLDSDDYFSDSDSLKKWYIYARLNNADLCKASHYIKKEKEVLKPNNYFTEKPSFVSNIYDCPEILNATSCWQFLYSSKFLREKNIRFSELLKQREDRLFFTLALLKSEIVAVYNLEAIVYRIRQNSTMRTIDLNQLKQFIIHVNELKFYIEDNKRLITDEIISFTMQYYVNIAIKYWIKLIDKPEYKQLLICINQISGSITYNPNAITPYLFFNKENDKVNTLFFLYLIENSYFDVAINLLQNKCLSREEINTLELLLDKVEDHKVAKKINEVIIESIDYIIKDSYVDEEIKNLNIYLHVGMPKTGSSSIQNFMLYNRQILLDRYEYLYPLTGLENGRGPRDHRTSGHALLIQGLINNNHEIKEKLNKEIYYYTKKYGKELKIVLSCENILSDRFWNNGECIDAIKESLSDFNVHIIGFFRNQVDWVDSMYRESVSSHGIKYSGSICDYSIQAQKYSFLNYEKLFEKLIATFGVNKVSFDSYLPNEDSIIGFLNLMKIEWSDSFKQPKTKELANLSVDSGVSYLLSTINKYCPQAGLKSLQANVISNAQKIEENKTRLMSDQEVFVIQEFFKKSNNNLKHKYNIDVTACYICSMHMFIPEEQAISYYNVEKLIRSIYNSSKDAELNVFSHDNFYDLETEKFLKSLLNRIRCTIDKNFKYKFKTVEYLYRHKSIDVSFYKKSYSLSNKSIYYHYVCNPINRSSQYFDGNRYLTINPDVKESSMNPLEHYIKHGKEEERIF